MRSHDDVVGVKLVRLINDTLSRIATRLDHLRRHSVIVKCSLKSGQSTRRILLRLRHKIRRSERQRNGSAVDRCSRDDVQYHQSGVYAARQCDRGTDHAIADVREINGSQNSFHDERFTNGLFESNLDEPRRFSSAEIVIPRSPFAATSFSGASRTPKRPTSLLCQLLEIIARVLCVDAIARSAQKRFCAGRTAESDHSTFRIEMTKGASFAGSYPANRTGLRRS